MRIDELRLLSILVLTSTDWEHGDLGSALKLARDM